MNEIGEGKYIIALPQELLDFAEKSKTPLVDIISEAFRLEVGIRSALPESAKEVVFYGQRGMVRRINLGKEDPPALKNAIGRHHGRRKAFHNVVPFNPQNS